MDERQWLIILPIFWQKKKHSFDTPEDLLRKISLKEMFNEVVICGNQYVNFFNGSVPVKILGIGISQYWLNKRKNPSPESIRMLRDLSEIIPVVYYKTKEMDRGEKYLLNMKGTFESMQGHLLHSIGGLTDSSRGMKNYDEYGESVQTLPTEFNWDDDLIEFPFCGLNIITKTLIDSPLKNKDALYETLFDKYTACYEGVRLANSREDLVETVIPLLRAYIALYEDLSSSYTEAQNDKRHRWAEKNKKKADSLLQRYLASL